jgi:acetoin utilization deacetylase AcuC-like enzyme
MNDSGLLARLLSREAETISPELILSVHTPEHLTLLEKISTLPRTVRIDADTYACPNSYEIARLSAGAAVLAVNSVVQGKAANGLVVARPPGHHAEPDRAMGFAC